jgi:uncharacterized protein (TIGR04255 family)
MAKVRPLRNPPITEAVIDLFAKLPSNIDLARLLAAHEAVKGDYPEVQKRFFFEGQFQVKDDKGSFLPRQQGQDGHLFKSPNGKQVFQARLDGFSFNRLKPYETWEKTRDEAKRLWAVYAKHACPEFVTRVALRFINQIPLTLPVADFGAYLTAPVPLPEGISTTAGFLTRVAVLDSKSTASATITQVFDPAPGATTGRLILDIEAACNPKSPLTADEAWATLESMRDFKNQCFFGSLTEKALEPFV